MSSLALDWRTTGDTGSDGGMMASISGVEGLPHSPLTLVAWQDAPTEAGIYAIISPSTGLAYVGMAGPRPGKSPSQRGIRGRLAEHFQPSHRDDSSVEQLRMKDAGDCFFLAWPGREDEEDLRREVAKVWSMTAILQNGTDNKAENRGRNRAKRGAPLDLTWSEGEQRGWHSFFKPHCSTCTCEGKVHDPV